MVIPNKRGGHQIAAIIWPTFSFRSEVYEYALSIRVSQRINSVSFTDSASKANDLFYV